jgi:hypothetical protein
LSAKDFYRQFAERIYGKAGTEKFASLYDIYDEWEARTPPATPGDDRPMLLGAGWCALALPDVPFTQDGLMSDKWKHTVKRAGKILEVQQQLLNEDRKSLEVLESVISELAPSGQSWAKLLKNRLEFRVLYLQSVMALNQSFEIYDQVSNVQGIKAGAKEAYKASSQSLKLAAESIEKYADDVRNRGDLGLIGQLNIQFYDLIARQNSQFQLDSLYVTIDWKALRMNVAFRSNLSDVKCWPLRDGVAGVETFTDEGKPALRVSLAGTSAARWGSRFIRSGVIDLEKEPLMDFYVRTSSKDAVALMFQIEGSNDWYEIDILGEQNFKQIDTINPILGLNDGQWHRVTWNLQKLVTEKIGKDVKSIKNLIVGTWTNPKTPVVIEFKDVCFGSFNQLDGQEVDR